MVAERATKEVTHSRARVCPAPRTQTSRTHTNSEKVHLYGNGQLEAVQPGEKVNGFIQTQNTKILLEDELVRTNTPFKTIC